VNRPSVSAKRRDCDPPAVIAREGWRFHHIGIPTSVARPGEAHLPWLKVHVSGFESSPYGIQWMRFDEDAPCPEVVKSYLTLLLKWMTLSGPSKVRKS
jgi:hypothetical protein